MATHLTWIIHKLLNYWLLFPWRFHLQVEKVQVDPDLRDTLNAAPNLDVLVGIANQHGYEFTVEEWQQATGFAVEELECELSEIPGI
ncbi:MAG: Nif11-like leader peptide family natural product precursor [Leptolyngbyaceae cyanobacterium]